MFNLRRHAPARAFVLIELVAVVLILLVAALLASLLVPDARRRARLAGSIQNLRQLGKAAASFAADNDNRVYSFDWKPGPASCGDYVFAPSTTYGQAAANQAVCILREHAGRTDITAIIGWLPNAWYSHLVLIDYLGGGLPSNALVSPGDAPRLAWARSIADDTDTPGAAYFALTCRPAGNTNADKRWPYSSSYEMQASFYSPDAVVRPKDGGLIVPTVEQDPAGHRYYFFGNPMTVLGNRRVDEIIHPSHKAFLYETNDRFHGQREPFFLYDEARVPVLFSEGSVSVRSINAANSGFQPNLPQSTTPTRVHYLPELAWETPTLSGSVSELIFGHIRWTRSGLRGRDFAGPEVPWVP